MSTRERLLRRFLVAPGEAARIADRANSSAGAARDRTDGVARSTGWRLAFEGE